MFIFSPVVAVSKPSLLQQPGSPEAALKREEEENVLLLLREIKKVK